MTNVTLSIDDAVYNKMKLHSEIKWSEFVRKIVEKRVNELEQLDKEDWDNARFLGDEKLLSESWASCQTNHQRLHTAFPQPRIQPEQVLQPPLSVATELAPY